MSALVEVIDSGLSVTIQDRGRPGYRSIGVPLSGALDPLLLAAANALLGNDAQAAALEVVMSGPSLKAVADSVRISLAGELSAKVLRSNGNILLVHPWSTATLFPGDIAQVGAMRGGVGYVGISGGFLVSTALGSRSTYQRAALGGVGGRALALGDRLPCGHVQGDPWLERRSLHAFEHDAGPIRVILGPQQAHFSDEAVQSFLAQPYTVTRDMDRMGMRLDGVRLKHNERGAEIISDGVVPGSIQVPANGYPIVLMADCQTSGGYPKIATVISADLPRLGHAKPGTTLHFKSVALPEAAQARRQQWERLALWVGNLVSFRPPGVINEEALYSGNLVSGAVRGDEFFMAQPCNADCHI